MSRIILSNKNIQPHIGIDHGGTDTKLLVVDGANSDKVLAKLSIPTKAKERTAEEISLAMIEGVLEAVKLAGLTLSDIVSMGIATPGAVEKETATVMSAFNLPYQGYKMGDFIKPILQKEGFKGSFGLDNDANAMGLIEYLEGAAQGAHSAVFATLGTGYGGAYIDRVGNTLTGWTGSATELGHLLQHAGGKACTCGGKGCIEAYASVSGLIDFTLDTMLTNPDSEMWEEALKKADNLDPTGEMRRKVALARSTCRKALPEAKQSFKEYLKGTRIVNGRTSFDAMRSGDIYAKGVVQLWRQEVAWSFITLINAFDPEVLVVGGAIIKEPDEYLLDPIRELTKPFKQKIGAEYQTRIKKARFLDDAGALGASHIARNEGNKILVRK